jgi:hypothetical protein
MKWSRKDSRNCEHRRINHQGKETECDDYQRKSEKLYHRLDQGIDQTEEGGNDQDLPPLSPKGNAVNQPYSRSKR